MSASQMFGQQDYDEDCNFVKVEIGYIFLTNVVCNCRSSKIYIVHLYTY